MSAAHTLRKCERHLEVHLGSLRSVGAIVTENIEVLLAEVRAAIAAEDAMLAALRDCLDMIARHTWTSRDRPRIDADRAAIAAAEGRT